MSHLEGLNFLRIIILKWKNHSQSKCWKPFAQQCSVTSSHILESLATVPQESRISHQTPWQASNLMLSIPLCIIIYSNSINQIAAQHNYLLNKFTSVEATCFGSYQRAIIRPYIFFFLIHFHYVSIIDFVFSLLVVGRPWGAVTLSRWGRWWYTEYQEGP
jgi:hypothetical protein